MRKYKRHTLYNGHVLYFLILSSNEHRLYIISSRILKNIYAALDNDPYHNRS